MQMVFLYQIEDIRSRLVSEVRNSTESKAAFCRRVGIHITHYNHVIDMTDTIPLQILKRLKLYRLREMSENKIRAYVSYEELDWRNLFTEGEDA